MAPPAELTYSQIETRVMNALRLPTTNATEQAKVQALINEVYRDLYLKYDFWFWEKRGVINTAARYNTGTVNVTNLSTAATLSSAPAAGLGSFAGYVLIITGDTNDNNAVYRIAAHTAGAAAITLDANFTGSTNATAAFNIYQDTYSAPTDLGKLLKSKRYGRDFPISPIGPSEMADLKASDLTSNKPDVITVSDFATTGDPTTARQIIVHPYPDKTYRIEFRYKQQLNTELSGSTQPFMPDEYRQVLVYGTLAQGYPIFLADVERGVFYQNKFNDTVNLMVAAHREYAQDRPQVAPRDQYRRYYPPRRVGRISLGTYFDRWPTEP